MKDTFHNLSEEKRERIIRAALGEFAASGYEKATLDGVVQAAGISKGGLYEYISSKEDLFRYLLEYSYGAMYDFIISDDEGLSMPADPVERTRHIALKVVDYYLANPEIITFLVKTSRISDPLHRKWVEAAFGDYFLRLFESCDYSKIRFDPARIRSLLSWLLAKTRNDFTDALAGSNSPEICRETYLGEWEFFFSVLTDGIYRGASSVDNKEE